MDFIDDPFPEYFDTLYDHSSLSQIQYVGPYFINQINDVCKNKKTTSQIHLFFKHVRKLCEDCDCDIIHCLENNICTNKRAGQVLENGYQVPKFNQRLKDEIILLIKYIRLKPGKFPKSVSHLI